MSQCSFCGLDITWKKPFTKGDRPLNLDNSAHTCVRPDTPETKSAVKSQVIEISDIIEEIKSIRKEFGEIESAKFESIMKYAISRMMRR